jgi:small subunit ribosomal protein S2
VGGLTSLVKMPDALFVWDIKEEATAVAEAHKKNIPVIGVCDTNVNPEEVNYPIPANDDATKTVKLLMEVIQSAIIDAKKDLKS